jgi:hypothetical protein
MTRAVALIGATVGSALVLAACGSSAGLIPASNATTISNDLSTLATALANHSCGSANAALDRVDVDINALPSSVNEKLISNLVKGYFDLANHVPSQCRSQTSSSTTPKGTSGTSTGTTGTSTGTTGTSTGTTGTSTGTTGTSTGTTGTSTGTTTPTGPTGTSIGPGGGSQAPTGSSGTGTTGASTDTDTDNAGGAASGD